MNNFWNTNNRSSGPLFGKKSAPAPAAPKDTPKPTSGLQSTARLPLAGSSGNLPNAKPDAGALVKVKFDHDIACGVYVGAFDVPAWVLSLDVAEVTDPGTGRVERIDGWLRPNDMLAILTREFGKARQKATAVAIRPDAPPHQRAQLTKERDEWSRRQNEMRDQVLCLLQTRHAYRRAEELGIKALIPAP